MSIFRDSSFKDPWIYIGVMAAIGLVYLAYLLVRHGRRGLDMPAMESIDAEASWARRGRGDRESRERVLAIDQGTSGTKAIVIDPGEGVVAEVEVELAPDYLPGGGVELDPGDLLESVLGAGREALAQSGGAIGGVALANQGETVLAWDQDTGRPLSRAIVWQDRRAAEVSSELSDRPGTFAARTALVLDPYFSAPKMAWLRRHVTREGVVTTTDSWLVHQLCGEFVSPMRRRRAGRSCST